MKPDRSKSKFWCFTVNNPENNEICKESIYCVGYNPDKHQYLLQGIETGKNGTRHIQGYVIFHKRCRLSQVKKFVPRAHWEISKGSPQQNYVYCTKDQTFHEHGVLPEKTQGKRNDLDRLHDTIRRSANIEDVIENHFAAFIKYPRGVTRAIEFYSPKRNWEMQNIVYWGASGVGKTKRAFEEHPEAYWKDNSPWWDGYVNQDVVIWDEFSGSSTPLSTFLRVTDRYPFAVPIKGGYTQFLAKKIIFTSNVDPGEWYLFKRNELRTAFFRRLTDIIEFKRLVNNSP